MTGYDFAEYHGRLDDGEVYGHIHSTGWHRTAVYQRLPDSEIQRRWRATREKMAALGLDCLVVPGSINAMSMGQGCAWLTGHLDIRSMANYCVFPMEGQPTLVYSMGGSHIEAVRQAVWVEDVRPAMGASFGRVIAERIQELGLAEARIGLMSALTERFGAEYLPANHYLTLKEMLPAAQLEFVPKFFHELMFRHSQAELPFIRRAGELCDRALEAMAAITRPGVTEAQLQGAAARAIYDGGGWPHLLIIAITSMDEPDAVFGNPRPSNRALKEGDIIVNELGAWYQGSSAQTGNPIVYGQPRPWVHDFFYDVVKPGFQAMAAVFKPGNTIEQVHQAGGDFFRRKGYQSRPGHLHSIDVVTAGPGVGVKAASHEGYDNELQPYMELMLEPCPITPDGRFGLFLGRTFVITPEGSEMVTRYPVELTVVEPQPAPGGVA